MSVTYKIRMIKSGNRGTEVTVSGQTRSECIEQAKALYPDRKVDMMFPQ